MTEINNDLNIIFVKLTEEKLQNSIEDVTINDISVKDYDEIRALREIVIDIQKPEFIYFAST